MYPPEVHEYNEKFTTLLKNIKKRHDPTVTTVAQGVLEWKRKQGKGRIGQSIQEWLDRFYMSRIGIRFLIGQRESCRMLNRVESDYRRRFEYFTTAPGLRRNHLYSSGELGGTLERAIADSRTSMIYAMKLSVRLGMPIQRSSSQKTPDMSVRTIMRCSKVLPSSFFVPKIYTSLTFLVICK